jgi:catechol 2,3-dioxygenase-like lactoylglutathione lyase family enzyme
LIAGIKGAHWLFYSQAPEADRAFLRDVLGFPAVDAGEGWLILALPPSEVAVHPGEGGFVQRHADHDLMGAVLYLMCADIREAVKSLEALGVRHAPIAEAEWGRYTVLQLPGGAGIGLYQPTHPEAIGTQGSVG